MAEGKVTAGTFYVYVLFRPDTGHPFYVGKGQGRRWVQHEMHSHAKTNSHKNAIIKKAKRLGLEIPKIKIAEGLTEDEAFKIERVFIKAIGREDVGGPLVNMSDGGEGQSGKRASAATRQRLSAASKKRIWPDDYSKEFVALAFSRQTGPASDETRAKISASKKAKAVRYTGDRLARHIEMLRNRDPVTDATRVKLSAWQVGRKRTEDAKQKMREGWARRKAALFSDKQGDLFEEKESVSTKR